MLYATKYYSSFDFLQLFKIFKAILASHAIQKQVVGGVGPGTWLVDSWSKSLLKATQMKAPLGCGDKPRSSFSRRT